MLGPFLYLLFTADIPTTEDTFIGTFADDTVIMSTDESQPKAVEKLQRALNDVSRLKNQIERIKISSCDIYAAS